MPERRGDGLVPPPGTRVVEVGGHCARCPQRGPHVRATRPQRQMSPRKSLIFSAVARETTPDFAVETFFQPFDVQR